LQSLGLFPLLWLLTRPRVVGRDNLEEVHEPVIFVANHNSHLDSLAVLYALPARLRSRTAVAAARDYFFKGRILGAATSLLVNGFPFARRGGTPPSLRYCAGLLSQGWSILMYPEGTRSTTGEICRFKSGVGLLSVEHGVPVVPIRVAGLDRVLPKGRSIPHMGKVEVHIGRPLYFEPEVSYIEATQAIEKAVRAL
jgi:long-chain acyl-CoA synthetase